MKNNEMATIFIGLKRLCRLSHQTAIDKGWYNVDESGKIEQRNFGEVVALMHSELSEALEAERHGNKPSEHIPDFSGVEEEFADVLIRIFDTCEAKGYDLAGAVTAKMEFNESRPMKHGGKKF